MSPSSSIWTRSTPWVDGCDGPIERDIFSVENSCGAAAALAALSGKEKSVAMTFGGLFRFFATLGPALVLGLGFGLAKAEFARRSDERAAHHRSGPDFRLGLRRHLDVGQFGLDAGEREFLAQREIGITLPHQDAAQVGMAGEADAEHIVGFALVPVGSRPESDGAGHGRLGVAGAGRRQADVIVRRG